MLQLIYLLIAFAIGYAAGWLRNDKETAGKDIYPPERNSNHPDYCENLD